MTSIWTSGTNAKLDGKWRWDSSSAGITSSSIKYSNWCVDEPDNFDGDEVFLVKTHSESASCWEDAGPPAKLPFICKPPLSNRILLNNLSKLKDQLSGIGYNEH